MCGNNREIIIMDSRVILAVLAYCACTVAQSTSHDPNCAGRGIQCPPFQPVVNETEYQLRSYDASTWACTTMRAARGVRGQMFWTLFRYISGSSNQQNQKIEMTAPVLMSYRRGMLEMCFFIPDRPVPVPNVDSGVTIVHMPAKQFYVRSYGGFMDRGRSMAELAILKNAIGNDQLYDSSDMYAAGYDPPYRQTGRHNELWLARVL